MFGVRFIVKQNNLSINGIQILQYVCSCRKDEKYAALSYPDDSQRADNAAAVVNNNSCVEMMMEELMARIGSSDLHQLS